MDAEINVNSSLHLLYFAFIPCKLINIHFKFTRFIHLLLIDFVFSFREGSVLNASRMGKMPELPPRNAL